MVRVLEQDPELGSQLSGRALEEASAAAIAPVATLQPGAATFPRNETVNRGHLGLLVLDGLIARHATFGSIGSTEFLGPRDPMRPWARPRDPGNPIELRWEVLVATRLA